MADCTNEIEIEKNSFHIKDNVFTKLFEFLETLNRTILGVSLKNQIGLVSEYQTLLGANTAIPPLGEYIRIQYYIISPGVWHKSYLLSHFSLL